jgi:transposase
MRYFAGLDVSLKETAICVVDENGGIVKEGRATSEPEALIAALQKVGLPLERVGLEACSLTAWLHTGLRQAGLPAICIETRQANAAMKTMPNRTDLSPRKYPVLVPRKETTNRLDFRGRRSVHAVGRPAGLNLGSHSPSR